MKIFQTIITIVSILSSSSWAQHRSEILGVREADPRPEALAEREDGAVSLAEAEDLREFISACDSPVAAYKNCGKNALQGVFVDGLFGEFDVIVGAVENFVEENKHLLDPEEVAKLPPEELLKETGKLAWEGVKFNLSLLNIPVDELEKLPERFQEATAFGEQLQDQVLEFSDSLQEGELNLPNAINDLNNPDRFREVGQGIIRDVQGALEELNQQTSALSCPELYALSCRVGGNLTYEIALQVLVARLTKGRGNAALIARLGAKYGDDVARIASTATRTLRTLNEINQIRGTTQAAVDIGTGNAFNSTQNFLGAGSGLTSLFPGRGVGGLSTALGAASAAAESIAAERLESVGV